MSNFQRYQTHSNEHNDPINLSAASKQTRHSPSLAYVFHNVKFVHPHLLEPFMGQHYTRHYFGCLPLLGKAIGGNMYFGQSFASFWYLTHKNFHTWKCTSIDMQNLEVEM